MLSFGRCSSCSRHSESTELNVHWCKANFLHYASLPDSTDPYIVTFLPSRVVQSAVVNRLDMDGNGWSIDCNMLWKKGEKIDSQLAGRFIVLTCFKNCFHFGHEWDHLAVKSKSGGYFLICGVGKFSELFWGVVVQENNCFLGWNLRRLSSSWWFQVSTLLGPWCQICGGSPHESEVGYTSPVT